LKKKRLATNPKKRVKRKRLIRIKISLIRRAGPLGTLPEKEGKEFKKEITTPSNGFVRKRTTKTKTQSVTARGSSVTSPVKKYFLIAL
jgi:hypothetical protein